MQPGALLRRARWERAQRPPRPGPTTIPAAATEYAARMMREVHGIPPAPRRVRWRAVLWYRWPLALAAFVLAIYGGAFTWMLFLAHGAKPSDNERLDRAQELGQLQHAEGEVTSLLGFGAEFPRRPAELHGQPSEHWSYHFTVPTVGGNLSLFGHCFAPAVDHLRVSQTVTVEYLAEEPQLSRIVGTRLDLLPWWVRPGLWLRVLVVPGGLCLLLWFTSALLLRHMMALGDVGVARVTAVRRLRFVVPGMLVVHFSFRDHHADERHGRHWVRVRSPLGGRLRLPDQVGERLPVLHGRRWPQFSRLALPADFLSERPPASPPKAQSEEWVER